MTDRTPAQQQLDAAVDAVIAEADDASLPIGWALVVATVDRAETRDGNVHVEIDPSGFATSTIGLLRAGQVIVEASLIP